MVSLKIAGKSSKKYKATQVQELALDKTKPTYSKCKKFAKTIEGEKTSVVSEYSSIQVAQPGTYKNKHLNEEKNRKINKKESGDVLPKKRRNLALIRIRWQKC